MKLLIDTDIGDDIDDALAIVLAFRLGADVAGITTAYKNTRLRARQVKKLLSLLGVSEVPVYAGCGDSLCGSNPADEVFCQYTPDLSLPEYAPDNGEEWANGESAVDFIIGSARKYGKDLTILGIAPLMNIARAIRKAPDAMRGVGRIVLMAGAFFEQFIEWNVLCDPEAAKTVLDFDVPVYCVGTDVTMPCGVTRDEYRLMTEGAGSELSRYLARIVEKWADFSRRLPVLHDPLAAYFAVTGKCVEFERHRIEVELGGSCCRGMTLNLDNVNRHAPNPQEGRRVSVGRHVNAEAFKRVFFDLVFAQNKKEEEIA